MKMRSNRIHDILDFIRKELSGKYDKREIENLITLIFEHYLGFDRAELVLHSCDTISESTLLDIHFTVKDLKKNKPIQYIFGQANFCGMTLEINEKVLIPRPETEELVEWIINDWQGRGEDFSVLDVGTGSACIALALKKRFGPKAQIFGLDYSHEIIDLAKRNAVLNETQVNFLILDLFNKEAWQDLPVIELIVSNPPYVTHSDKHYMKKGILNYEPHEALFVPGNNALVFYDLISELALQKLDNEGMLYFEINEKYAQEISALLKGKGFKDVVLKKDIHEKDRMIKCRKRNE